MKKNKKFKKSFLEKIQDVWFRLKLRFFFKDYQGKSVNFVRIYSKVNIIKQGWLASNSPKRNVYLIINEDESYWTPQSNIYEDKVTASKDLVFIPGNETMNLFEIRNDTLIIAELQEEENVDQMLKDIEKNAAKLLKGKK